MTLRLPDSGADISIDGRRHAPSAIRNQSAILDVLRVEAPATGKLLEIASGSGQHAYAGAKAMPGLICGNRMCRKAWMGGAPRSWAAVSWVKSNRSSDA